MAIDITVMGANDSAVLVVDLDGTLVQTDLLHECLFAMIRQAPWALARVPAWLMQGRARLKRRVAERVVIDVTSLPYNEALVGWLSEEHLKGRRLVLATGSDAKLAEAVANHLGIFESVIGSDGELNLTGVAKRDILVAKYGAVGFSYVGNSKIDLHVWKASQSAIVVSHSESLAQEAAKLTRIEKKLGPTTGSFFTWLRAIRLHQWLKNLLVILPMLAAHRAFDVSGWANCIIAFMAFGIAASSVYLLNDLLDIDDDRHHRSKKNRPFAAGTISLLHGALAVPLLFFVALGLMFLLPWRFGAVLCSYYLTTFFYSIFLKRLVMVDVVTLAILYTLRIVAGAVAVTVPLSFWLLAFSMFIFLSLALLKRYSELIEMQRAGRLAKARGRGYHVDDLSLLVSLGAAAGYASVMVLALYINSESVIALYREPRAIWFACPLLLFWISRAWLIAHRGEMHDDPVIYAVRDNISRVVGLLLAVSFWFAL